MKILLRLFIILVLAFLLSCFAYFEVGSVVFYVGHYQAQMSLSFFVIALIAICVCSYYCVRLFLGVKSFPSVMRNFSKQRISNKMQHKLFDAIMSYFAGQYKQSYTLAYSVLKREKTTENLFLAHLIANKSANSLRKVPEAQEQDVVLQKFTDKKYNLVVLANQAQHAYTNGEYNLCLKYTEQLALLDKNNVLVLKLSFLSLIGLDNSVAAFNMLDKLVASNIFSNEQINHYKKNLLTKIFNTETELEVIKQVYKKLSKEDKLFFQIENQYNHAMSRLS